MLHRAEEVPEDEAAQEAAAGTTDADSLPEEEETAVEEGTPLVVPYQMCIRDRKRIFPMRSRWTAATTIFPWPNP